MNNRTLLFIFLGLLAIYGLSQLLTGKRTSNFDTELIQIDTSQVTAIVIRTKAPNSEEINLQREEGGWIVSSGTINTRALPSAVNSLLSNLHLIKTKYIAANAEEKWPDYEVGQDQGTRIQVFDGEKVLEDFISGRFSYDQQAQTGTSYIRLTNGKEVYAVDGFQTLTLGQGFNSYRDRTLTDTDLGISFDRFRIQQHDTDLEFAKNKQGWMIGDEALDSTKVENYLNQFKGLRGDSFADDFDEIQAPNYQIGSISLESPQLPEALQISVYQDTSRAKPFIFRSTTNPEAWFESDSSGLFQRIIKTKTDFLPDVE